MPVNETRAEKSRRNKEAHRKQKEAERALIAATTPKARVIDNKIRSEQKHDPNNPLMLGVKNWDRDKVMAIVCERIASTSRGLAVVLSEPFEGWELPTAYTIHSWLDDEKYARAYTKAKKAQADLMADEIVSIADDGLNDTYVDKYGNQRVDRDVTERSKLRVSTRIWLMGKLNRNKYGDNIPPQPTEDPESTAAKVRESLRQMDEVTKS